MRILLQRVSQASVTVDQNITGSIGRGLLLLVGFGKEDLTPPLSRAAEKVCQLRVFPNEEGKFDRSVLDIGGSILAVSQFTLYGETEKGRRPDFYRALEPTLASAHFDAFVSELRNQGVVQVATGVFGAQMAVSLINDGPVTLMLEL